MEGKSFVLTGYVERSTCNCGCVSHNCFWQDGGFGGSSYLASLHHGIEKYLDELSGAKPGENGKPRDVKVTVTIEPLGPHEHRILNRNAFSGLGFEDNRELRGDITRPAEPEEVVKLRGEDQYDIKQHQNLRHVGVTFLQDIHDRLLLIQRTGDTSKVGDLMDAVQEVISREE